MEDTNKMSRKEAIALRDFVKKRFEKLYPCPKFYWGKTKWHEMMLQFEHDFLEVLMEGKDTFWGTVWQFFDGDDNIFLGDEGLRELLEHTFYENGKWVYRAGEKEEVIYND